MARTWGNSQTLTAPRRWGAPLPPPQPGARDEPFGYGLYAAGLRRALLFLLGRGAAGAGDEGERHAVHLGVFGVETALLVQFITHPAQAPADYLLAEQLRAESADAED